MAKTQSYQQLQAELQAILDWFESDDIDLEAAIKKYQQASLIIADMEKYLKTAKNKITKLTENK
jgi:exodeoxyribonuclease VII small subunit